MNLRMAVMSGRIKQTAECIFHCTSSFCINMTFNCRLMQYIFSYKIIRNSDAVRKNFIKDKHFPFRRINNPFHIFSNKIEFHVNSIFFIKFRVFIVFFAFIRITDNSLILNADNIFIACIL